MFGSIQAVVGRVHSTSGETRSTRSSIPSISRCRFPRASRRASCTASASTSARATIPSHASATRCRSCRRLGRRHDSAAARELDRARHRAADPTGDVVSTAQPTGADGAEILIRGAIRSRRWTATGGGWRYPRCKPGASRPPALPEELSPWLPRARRRSADHHRVPRRGAAHRLRRFPPRLRRIPDGHVLSARAGRRAAGLLPDGLLEVPVMRRQEATGPQVVR